MSMSGLWETLKQGGGKIVYLVLDGVGGLPDEGRGGTELEVAHTPNLDRLAGESSCGMLEIVGPGITPGSGPGHLALFGYDPERFLIGRGVLSALGIDFGIEEGDIAARINFATVDDAGNVVDRRAGRIATETNRRLCDRLRDAIELDLDGSYFLETVSEHRAVLVLRGRGLGGHVSDTDPQKVGVPPLEAQATAEDSENTAALVRSFVEQARETLAKVSPANAVLLRGFEKYHRLPTLRERFGLKGVCIADYPMYRGLSRLLGFDVMPPPGGIEKCFETLRSVYPGSDHDFFFLHVKDTDKAGEDGDFDAKVQAIETVDRALPKLLATEPDVLVVTADHSAPAAMAAHSWHPVPVLLRARHARRDRVERFSESDCIAGGLGFRRGTELMGLALAHAGRLKKYGA